MNFIKIESIGDVFLENMAAWLFEPVKKAFGKKKSIIPSFFFLFIVYLSIILFLDSTTFRSFTPTTKHYTVFGGIFALAWFVYTVQCFVKDCLPVAPEESNAVLFVVDAESSQLFNDVKFKLVGYFTEIPTIDEMPFQAICISRDMLKKYDFGNKKEMVDLLEKTNCIFLVDVKYAVDNVTNAENYEMRTNYGIIHPRFKDEALKVFSQDINTLGTSVGRQRFTRTQIFDTFSFTAHSLSLICQYLICFTYLLSGRAQDACQPLCQLSKRLDDYDQNFPVTEKLRPLVLERLFSAYIQSAFESITQFEEYKESAYLDKARDYLSDANEIHPDTYVYNLNMAYIYIAKDKSYNHARQCIDKCKQTKQDNIWKYSDAFLYAYSGKSANTVLSKYRQALSVPYNLVRIADFIEYVLEQEPQKVSLHFAAALIYEALGDSMQMKRHLSCYPIPNQKINDITREMIVRNPCDTRCDGDCASCKDCSNT